MTPQTSFELANTPANIITADFDPSLSSTWLFSSREERQEAEEAEARTGLRAREIFRPASQSDCGLDVFPRNPRMRCQLGILRHELRQHGPVEGVCDAFDSYVDIFELVAYGRTWADAVAAVNQRIQG